MSEYLSVYKDIEDVIDNLTTDTVKDACKMLDDFWLNYCETNKTIFWLITWTAHNHAAKGAWANLDYKLRNKLKELNVL